MKRFIFTPTGECRPPIKGEWYLDNISNFFMRAFEDSDEHTPNFIIFKLEEEDYVWNPEMGEVYYVPDITEESLYREHTWINDKYDILWFNRGLVFRTKEEAIAKAKQMLNLN